MMQFSTSAFQDREMNSMLLVLPVPFRRKGDGLLIESQARRGLERWAENFDRLVVATPTIPEDLAEQDRTIDWVDSEQLECRDRVELVPLPWAYRISDFLRHYRSTRRRLAELIPRCQYLQFAISGLVGDWAAVAAREAARQGRPFSVHTDNVGHRMMRIESRGKGLGRRLKAEVLAPPTRLHMERIFRRSELALLNGMDCYAEYKDFCKNGYLIEDIHIDEQDRPAKAAIEAKADNVRLGGPLRVCYAGRAIPIKAPLEWVRALAAARELGTEIEATWLGDGTQLEEMRTLANELGLADCLRTPGFVGDRAKVLEGIRDAHLMPFCHVSPESPRCLREALICGTPIVGYASDYSAGLLEGQGGGLLVPKHDWQALARALHELDRDRDRTRLADLIRQAASNGARFSSASAFRHRSNLIKQYLSDPIRDEQALETR